MTTSPGRTRTIRETVHGDDVGGARPGVLIVFSEAEVPGDGIYPARPEVTVGRSPDCTIFLEDPGMSRFHAVLSFDGERATVRDGGSHNGTHVNGARAEGVVTLAPGDVLRCGQTLLALVGDVGPYRGWRTAPQGSIVGGPVIRCVLADVEAFARTDLEVLITGESGTGKELVARKLHRLSGRAGPFVPVNCAAITESLFEAELFGAVRGAFTGAAADRPGLFVGAAGGTLFLDEVGELPLAMQAKLLRAVEQREVRPVGGQQPVTVDVRLAAATNRDLQRAVEQGAFRDDLYHRLYGARIHLPPLRERREDLPLLAEHLLRRQEVAPRPTAAFMTRLLLYAWPGNVRELDRVLREAAARAQAEGVGKLLPRHLRRELQEPAGPAAVSAAVRADPFERVRQALAAEGGNVSRAAAALGMHRAQIYALLREKGLRAEDFR
jgi:DNA-binding NtrC family response regulator